MSLRSLRLCVRPAAIGSFPTGLAETHVSFTYDPFDRRIAKTVSYPSTPNSQPSTEIFVYDGIHIALVFTDPDAGDPQSSILDFRFLYGPAVDQVLSEEQIQPDGSAKNYWLLSDHLGSIRDIISPDCNGGGHIDYTAFGGVAAVFDYLGNASTLADLAATRFLFTGREYDAEIDLQYNRARYYDAAIGRWLSKDPIGFGGGDANLYRYVGNSATNYGDPSGLQKNNTSFEDGILDRGGKELRPGGFSYGTDQAPKTADDVRDAAKETARGMRDAVVKEAAAQAAGAVVGAGIKAAAPTPGIIKRIWRFIFGAADDVPPPRMGGGKLNSAAGAGKPPEPVPAASSAPAKASNPTPDRPKPPDPKPDSPKPPRREPSATAPRRADRYTPPDRIAEELRPDQIAKHGDPNTWTHLGTKSVPATGVGFRPGDRKVYEVFLDENGKRVGWHYWIKADGTIEGGKFVFPETTNISGG